MGITGLLPFLEKSSKRTNINEFAGGTVAIDSYCWLHKGAFSCADKLSMGQPTDAYVDYCMKFIYMLFSHKIKPILVFDGRHLPAKAQTEAKRREARQTNRRKGIELIKMGQYAEGRNLLRRSLDITHEIALELIKQCQKMNIDCIVAPYEADAQLAYLNISGIADVVITEDSDLTLFGCKKVFFKMDVNGNGLLVDQERLHLAMDLQAEHFSMENFRYMCILSGCDYLPSLPGIGLIKAKKFIMRNTDCDIHRALTRLGSYLNMKSLVVTKEYRDAFMLADITFKHQLVFCPLQRKQVRLHPPLSDVTEEQLYYAGTETDSDTALQLALGNCDPFSLQILHDFDPDKTMSQDKCNTWGHKSIYSQHISIWAKHYKLTKSLLQGSPRDKNLMTWPNTVGKEMVLQTNLLKRAIFVEQEANPEYTELNGKEILNMYESNENEIENNFKTDVSTTEEIVSPVLIRRTNPFSQQPSSDKTSPSLLSKGKSRIKGRNIRRVRRTVINEDIITESKFFAKSSVESNVETDDDRLSSSNNSNISQKKENMNFQKTNSTNNVNLQSLMETDEMERESHSMDVDEEHTTSFASNQRNDDDCLNSFSNCNLEKSYSDVQVNESVLNKDNEQSYTLSDSVMPLKPTIDTEFLIPQEDISTLSSSFFTGSNTNLSVQLNNRITHSKRKNSSNFRAVNSKANITSTRRKSQDLCSVQRQQSLLSMYGFEKKKPI
ncbi:PREDICTED: exonuclease 1 [Dufourea novaeangliae]|uniref:exonuclease 1 n=1 Tax=Dufourea novaeangliae TaxID=178035 RepID=UPI0007676A5A|nr:PREDICTED: exonuclease 1 [Dufourea novaeangliae]